MKSFIVTKTESERYLVEAGSTPARLVQIIDLGTKNLSWQGESRMVKRVLFVFELPENRHIFDETIILRT